MQTFVMDKPQKNEVPIYTYVLFTYTYLRKKTSAENYYLKLIFIFTDMKVSL